MENKSLNIIIAGSSGMVGEGVLYECLQDHRVGSILILSRKASGITHPKVTEIVQPDLYDLSHIENRLTGYSTCFYCIGITSVGKTEEEYFNLTYTLTLYIASTLRRLNPAMTFCYISAAGADNSEKGNTMWARVKGKTENDLQKLSFAHFYAFRPFLLTPGKGLTKTHDFYKYISWLFPFGRILYPNRFCTLRELALSMISVGYKGFTNIVVKPKDMVKLAKEKDD